MAKITIEELSGSLKEYLNGLGLTEAQVLELIDKFEDEKIGVISQLSTQEKGSLVGAINELFQSANNGKQLIANAIGEPLSSEDTFSAMSNDINSLLSTFKTNMMNNGIMVESGDKFKQLIDKVTVLVDNLRDSLASILENKGVDVTEEDDMASLITKVDEEFNDKNNEIDSLNTELVECRDTLKQILIDKKIEGLENENKLSALIDKIKSLKILTNIPIAGQKFILHEDTSSKEFFAVPIQRVREYVYDGVDGIITASIDLKAVNGSGFYGYARVDVNNTTVVKQFEFNSSSFVKYSFDLKVSKGDIVSIWMQSYNNYNPCAYRNFKITCDYELM